MHNEKNVELSGGRRRDQPMTRWKDTCGRDIRSLGLDADEVMDGAMWRRIMNSLIDTRDDGRRQRRRSACILCMRACVHVLDKLSL